MAYLTTNETKKYLNENELENSDKILKELVKTKKIIRRKYPHWLYDQDSISNYVQNPKAVSHTQGDISSVVSLVKDVLNPRSGSGLLLALILICFAVLILVLTIHFPQYAVIKIFAFIIFSCAIVILLKNVVAGVENMEIELKYATIRGSGVFLIALIAIVVGFELFDRNILTNGSGGISKKEYDRLVEEKDNLKGFTDNLSQLIADEKITIPTDLNLSIECFEKKEPVAFGYTAYKQNFSGKYNIDRQDTGINESTDIRFEKRYGEFIIHKLNNENELIGAVTFDNSNYMKTAIKVALSGRRLCEEDKYVGIDSETLKDTVTQMGKDLEGSIESKFDFLEFSKTRYKLIAEVQAVIDSSDEDLVISIGNTLFDMSQHRNEYVNRIAIDILSSVDVWDTTSPLKARAYLDKLESAEIAKHSEDRYLKMIRKARNNINSSFACRRSTVGGENWNEILSCLEKNEFADRYYDFQKLEARLNVAFINKNLEEQIQEVATNFTVFASEIEPKEENEFGSIARPSRYSDSLVLSAFAHILHGDLNKASEVVQRIHAPFDPNIDSKYLNSFLGINGPSNYPTDIIAKPLFKILQEVNSSVNSSLSFDQRKDLLRETLTNRVETELKLVPLIIKADENWTKEEASIILLRLKDQFLNSSHSIFQKYPVLRAADSLKLSPNPHDTPYFLIMLAPANQNQALFRSQACEVQKALTNLISYDIKIRGSVCSNA